ncbi:hypothetical protein HK096_000778, partial [Nowakowskiella sp. JEL0078]
MDQNSFDKHFNEKIQNISEDIWHCFENLRDDSESIDEIRESKELNLIQSTTKWILAQTEPEFLKNNIIRIGTSVKEPKPTIIQTPS